MVPRENYVFENGIRDETPGRGTGVSKMASKDEKRGFKNGARRKKNLSTPAGVEPVTSSLRSGCAISKPLEPTESNIRYDPIAQPEKFDSKRAGRDTVQFRNPYGS
ncbi:hypothetical protein TNCV_4096161 [Trichonephila clavipes]|nr:hypothetical protein TNCV_4096161 [Trichonephila clavipes]